MRLTGQCFERKFIQIFKKYLIKKTVRRKNLMKQSLSVNDVTALKAEDQGFCDDNIKDLSLTYRISMEEGPKIVCHHLCTTPYSVKLQERVADLD